MNITIPTNSSCRPPLYQGGREIPALQMLKALAAFAIVDIHFGNGFIRTLPLDRTAVPIFLMITGYFLLNADGYLTLSRIKHTLIKVVKLDLIAQLIYLVMSIIEVAFWTPEKMDLRFSTKALIEVVLVGNSWGGVLWYLHGVAQALVVLYLLVRYNRMKWLPWLSAIGLAICIVVGCYKSAILPVEYMKEYYIHRNFFTTCLPMMFIGMTIRLNEHKINKSFKQLGWLSFAFLVALYCEYEIVARVLRLHSCEIYICNLPLAVCLFCAALKAPAMPRLQALVTNGRKHSQNIFLFHGLVQRIVVCPPLRSAIHIYTVSPIIYLLTLLLSLAINRCRKR
jgi:surface polysaccharide O-acyltransferase-like enzyme